MSRMGSSMPSVCGILESLSLIPRQQHLKLDLWTVSRSSRMDATAYSVQRRAKPGVLQDVAPHNDQRAPRGRSRLPSWPPSSSSIRSSISRPVRRSIFSWMRSMRLLVVHGQAPVSQRLSPGADGREMRTPSFLLAGPFQVPGELRVGAQALHRVELIGQGLSRKTLRGVDGGRWGTVAGLRARTCRPVSAAPGGAR